MKTMTRTHRNGSTLDNGNLMKDTVNAAEQIAKAAKEAKSSATKAMEDLHAYCDENPGKAMGIAAGVAAMVSLSLVKMLTAKKSPSEKVFTDLFHSGEQAWKHLKAAGKPALQKNKKSVPAAKSVST